jgi:hypothetical protein
MTRSPIPLRPDPSAVAKAALASLAKGVAISAGGRLDQQLGQCLRGQWSDDRAALLVARSATTPHSLSDTALAPSFVRAVVEALGPASAGAQLLGQGLQLAFDSYASISVPGFVASAAQASFVAEGAPIPMRALSVSSPATVLSPRKLVAMTSLTSEMLASSNAEALVTDVLSRAIGLALDGIREREIRGAVELPVRPLRRGDRVRVLRGPFCELEGLFAGQAAHDRVAILLSLLGGHQRVTLPKDDVEAM